MECDDGSMEFCFRQILIKIYVIFFIYVVFFFCLLTFLCLMNPVNQWFSNTFYNSYTCRIQFFKYPGISIFMYFAISFSSLFCFCFFLYGRALLPWFSSLTLFITSRLLITSLTSQIVKIYCFNNTCWYIIPLVHNQFLMFIFKSLLIFHV